MNRVIVMGSPRSNGRCAHLAEMLFEANIDECPEDELYLIPVSELDIAPCVGCGACRVFAKRGLVADEAPAVEETHGEGEAAGEEDEAPDYPYCPRFDDDMQDVYALLPYADELVIVAPVFFSGAPASLKAVLDRMQPHFWADTRKQAKRPATLHVVGEGGDPHGYGPLVSEVKSALAVAGFRLERVLDWVGKIDTSGQIIAEADVVEDIAALVAPGAAKGAVPVQNAGRQGQPGHRPQLDLGSSRDDSRAQGGRRTEKPKRQGGKQGGQKAGKQSSGKQGHGSGKNASRQGERQGNGRTTQRGRTGAKQSGKGRRNGQ